MLFQNATAIVQTQEADLLPGEVIHEEGLALVWVREGGHSFLRLSTGAADEVFAGFALARSMPPANMNRVEEFVIDATKNSLHPAFLTLAHCWLKSTVLKQTRKLTLLLLLKVKSVFRVLTCTSTLTTLVRKFASSIITN